MCQYVIALEMWLAEEKGASNGLRGKKTPTTYYCNYEHRGINKSLFHVLYLTGVIIHQWERGLNC